MLHEFLNSNRAELIGRCRAKVARRGGPDPGGVIPGMFGIPHFLNQVCAILKDAATRSMSPQTDVNPEITATAMQHGGDLLQQGFTIEQVVHCYGDLCQAVTELASETGAAITVNEFRTLNGCLDQAIAGAVSEFSTRRESSLAGAASPALNERLGMLAHELRGYTHTAMLAVAAIKEGNVGLRGATGGVLDRSLLGLRSLIDRSLAEVRLAAGMPAPRPVLEVAAFINELRIAADLEARSRGCKLTIGEVDPALAVRADRDMLFSAVNNLLQNACKFTQPGTEVVLSVRGTGERVLIEVRDHCGGLPAGITSHLFLPFTQVGKDRSGLGLGLTICRRGVEANGGSISVVDLPGEGCAFTIDLPRHTAA